MRGEYPAYALKNWKRKGYDIKMELEDAQIQRGTVMRWFQLLHV
jgi:6-phospho-beta-glucosidase